MRLLYMLYPKKEYGCMMEYYIYKYKQNHYEGFISLSTVKRRDIAFHLSVRLFHLRMGSMLTPDLYQSKWLQVFLIQIEL